MILFPSRCLNKNFRRARERKREKVYFSSSCVENRKIHAKYHEDAHDHSGIGSPFDVGSTSSVYSVLFSCVDFYTIVSRSQNFFALSTLFLFSSLETYVLKLFSRNSKHMFFFIVHTFLFFFLFFLGFP